MSLSCKRIASVILSLAALWTVTDGLEPAPAAAQRPAPAPAPAGLHGGAGGG